MGYMHFTLTEKQEAIIIGTLLGDGYLHKSFHGSSSLEVKQSDSKKEYVFWLYHQLKELCGKAPYQRKDNLQWRFYTYYLRELTQFHEIFYQERKIVPRNIKEILENPLSLAIWYMDDGMLDFRPKSHYAFRLSVNCFSLLEVQLLTEVLRDNFNIEATIHTPLCRGKRYPLIYIGQKGRARFLSFVKPYILSCFSYKLPPVLPNPSETLLFKKQEEGTLNLPNTPSTLNHNGLG